MSRWDPEGLLALGAPADEYGPEADSFAALLGQGVTITPEVVRQVWERWFGPGSTFVRSSSPAALADFAGALDQAAAEAQV
ncbi:hypothetical protein [Saccharothrix texasensis]|uniref:Uncharacterized protein n=1 Tax=Saccharothrix texasensis TaxID=103734 RepID=A0A3N1H8H6_9PSEU|nr:hypothetical protein [Saccharothrix texasensis]ROP38835.1 hypothetical protein EDD40_4200 [Saccharothrix texasensis]